MAIHHSTTTPYAATPATPDTILPAVQRTQDNHLTNPQFTLSYFVDELNVSRLHLIYDWLWAAGRPMPPRPLHHQLLLGRQIFVTERLDLHLLWLPGRILLKPLPRYLLLTDFWALLDDSSSKKDSRGESIALIARGFLSSYIALINHESDFAIARSAHLLPDDLTWAQWSVHCAEYLSLSASTPVVVDRRFHYGELRLSRINTIYRFTRPGHVMRGYMSRWNDYGTFLRAQFRLVAAITVYTVVVLTAMQVGLATDRLMQNRAFQMASYGFTIFSIIAPVGLCVGILVVFLVVFVINWKVALSWKRSGVQAGRNVA